MATYYGITTTGGDWSILVVGKQRDAVRDAARQCDFPAAARQAVNGQTLWIDADGLLYLAHAEEAR